MQYLGGYKEELYNQNVKYAFEQLRALEPYLHDYQEGVPYDYPSTQDEVDSHFEHGHTWIVSAVHIELHSILSYLYANSELIDMHMSEFGLRSIVCGLHGCTR